MSTFCTSIHCMDGRIQEPLIHFLKTQHGAAYVDAITDAGPCKLLPAGTDQLLSKAVLDKVEISKSKHGSKLIAISGHHDCAGNPCDREVQEDQIRQSVDILKGIHPEMEVIGLWVDAAWQVHQV